MNKTLMVMFAALTATTVAWSAGQDIKDAPDGAAIKLFPDGAYQITAVGTGVYDFNDPDDIKDARKEAEMRAKVAIANSDATRREAEAEAQRKATAAEKVGGYDGYDEQNDAADISQGGYHGENPHGYQHLCECHETLGGKACLVYRNIAYYYKLLSLTL